MVQMTLSENEASYFLTLPEKKRRLIVEKVHRMLRKVADKQIEFLKEFKKDKSLPKTARHFYFFAMVESFWKDADFAISLGKKQYASYAVYPSRTMMEKALKLMWFTRQDTSGQDLITKKELCIQCLNMHEMGKEEIFREHYEEYNSLILPTHRLPDFDKVMRSDLKAFPSYQELCLKSTLVDASTLYPGYRYLSGLPHGDLLITYLINSLGLEKEEYRRAFMLASRFSMEMLALVDFHLGHRTKNEVEEVLAKSKALLKNPLPKSSTG